MNTKDYIKSLKITGIVLSVISIFVFLYSIQTSFGYSGTGTTQDLKSGSRINGDILAQPFNGSVTIYFGTQSTSPLGTGTVGHIGTNTAGLPKLRYSYTNGSSTVTFDGFDHVAINGSDIPLAGSLSAKLDAVGGVGTNNTFNNPSIAGQGTTTATVNYNGLNISPVEVSYLDGMTENISNKLAITTGSVTNHVHSGSDGTTKISHTDLTSATKGTQTHPQIDDFIASKAQASGIASLNANSLVVQNPTNATGTPTASKIVQALPTGKIDDGWISSTFSPGTPTFSAITGVPSDNTQLAKFLDVDTLKLPGTTTPLIGTGTSQRIYNLVRYAAPIVGTNTTALMTSNTAPSPNVVAVSSENPDPPNTMEGYRAFDRVILGSNRWLANATETAWISYEYGAGNTKRIGEYRIACAETAYAPKNWTFEGSNNGSSWTVLDTQTNQTAWTTLVYRNYIPTSTGLYRYYRLNISISQGSGYVGFSEAMLLESDVNYTYNTFQIIPPGTTTAFLTVVDDGTYSANLKLVLGGEPYSTTTVYGLDASKYNLIAKSLVVAPSSSKVKTDLPGETSPQEEVLGIVRNSKAHKYLYKDKTVLVEIAESKAKSDYIHSQRASEFKLFRDLHENEYREGTIGSTSVNSNRLMIDFEKSHQDKMSIKWNSLNDKNSRITEAKAHLEKDPKDIRNNTANFGIEIDRDCPKEILNSDGLPVLEKWAGFNFTAIKGLVDKLDLQSAEIGSITAAFENQKIAYNEEVDNLYKLINAIIVSLVAVGGVSVWSTIRRKRKGT